MIAVRPESATALATPSKITRAFTGTVLRLCVRRSATEK
jgi:hypothetical protein